MLNLSTHKQPIVISILVVATCFIQQGVAAAAVEKVTKKTQATSTTASGQKLTVGDRLLKLERQQKAGDVKKLNDRIEQLESQLAALEGKLAETEHQIEKVRQEQMVWAKSIDQQLSDTQRQALHQKTQEQELKLYESALNAIKQKQYKEALEQLSKFVELYPNSKHIPNSYYWMAEAHLLSQQHEQSEEALKHILSHYPDHIKVPDVLHKLVMLYSHKNQPDKARQYYKQLQTSYEKSPAFVAAKKQFSHFST